MGHDLSAGALSHVPAEVAEEEEERDPPSMISSCPLVLAFVFHDSMLWRRLCRSWEGDSCSPLVAWMRDDLEFIRCDL